jgi:sugar phosphate isomerase/epimerase
MKLGVSSLAWDINSNEANILESLVENNIKYLEIVIPKYVNWYNVNLQDITKFSEQCHKYGIDIISTQSILFNSNVTSFHDIEFIDHMKLVSSICGRLGITYLVLGAPGARKNSIDIGLQENFHYINELMTQHNTTLLLEPNCRQYNGNYFYTVNEIVDFIKNNNLSNIKTMIDTHNVTAELESTVEVYLNNKEYIQHIHVSETGLSDFNHTQEHESFASILKSEDYNGIIVYESKPSENLITSIQAFSKTYNI